MPRISLIHRWTRAIAAVGLGALLAAGPAARAAAPVTASGTSGFSVTTIPLKGMYPWGSAVDSASGLVYVPASYTNSVSVIDEATNTVANVIGFGSQEPLAVAVDAKTDTVYVALTDPPALEVLDGATNVTTATYSLPGAPNAVTLNADASALYVAYGNSVSAIDTATGTVVGTTDLGLYNHAMYLAMDPATGTLYAAGSDSSGAGTVWLFDATSLAVIKAIPIGTDLLGIAVDPATNKAYVADQDAGVYVIDGGSYAVTRIDTYWGANGVAVDAATDTIFAALAGQVAVINGATAKVTMTIPAGSNAWHGGIVADPSSGNVYAAAYGSSSGYVSALIPGISPVFTNAASATFNTGSGKVFTISTSGGPAASVTESGSLPTGIAFAAEPGVPGTAVLDGTPAAGSGGIYPVRFNASNGVYPGAIQLFTLVVYQAPVITSARKAQFNLGERSRFRITASGFPVPTLTEKGRLPPGFSFRAGSDGTATISGKPDRSQIGRRYRVKITARNSRGQISTQELTILLR